MGRAPQRAELAGVELAIGVELARAQSVIGERHLRHRRMLLPPFHGDAVRAYRERIAELAAEEVERWPVGETFPIRPRMQAIALEVILRTVIGVSDKRRLERLRGLLRRLTRVGLLEM